MTTPLSLEQRILIAAEYNADRVEVIKELMEEEAKLFDEWRELHYGLVDVKKVNDVNIYVWQTNDGDEDYTSTQLYKLYLQSNKQVKP